MDRLPPLLRKRAPRRRLRRLSEVIESYIRRHPGLSEKESFEGFLKEERIRSWVGADESRKERLRSEFGRVWGSLSVQGKLASPTRVGAGGPARSTAPAAPAQMQAPRPVRVDVKSEQKTVAPVAMPPGAGTRKLQVMCTACGRVDVWMHGDIIGCRRCGHVYDDMLQLIRVTPVGPFAFLFGEGWVGYATATGIVGGLAALYFLLVRGF